MGRPGTDQRRGGEECIVTHTTVVTDVRLHCDIGLAEGLRKEGLILIRT